jgi:autotransporter-associated beta strand protein
MQKHLLSKNDPFYSDTQDAFYPRRKVPLPLFSLCVVLAVSGEASAQGFIAQGPSPSTGSSDIIQSGDSNGGDTGNVAGAVGPIAVVPNSDTMYVGTPNGGIWKSINDGASWTALTNNQASLSIASLALDPANPATLIAGTGLTSNGSVCSGDSCFVTGSGGLRNGLLLSNNGGTSWTPLNPGGIFTNQTVADVAVRGQTILAGTYETSALISDPRTTGGLYISTNGGANFNPVSAIAGSGLPAGPATSIVGDLNNAKTLYVALTAPDISGYASTAIYQSINGGTTWGKVFSSTNSSSINSTDQTAIKLAAGPNGSVAAEIIDLTDKQNVKAIFLSTDNGKNWAPLRLPTLAEPTAGGQGAINSAIAIDPKNQNVVYVSGVASSASPYYVPVYKIQFNATDNSSNITCLSGTDQTSSCNGSGVHADSRALAFNSRGDLILSSDSGIYLRTQPQSSGAWSPLNGNLSLFAIQNIAYDANSKRIVTANQDTGVALQSVPNSPAYNAIQPADGTVAVINDTTMTNRQSAIYSSVQNLVGLSRLVVDANGNTVSEVPVNLTIGDKTVDLSVNNTNTLHNNPFVLNKTDQSCIAVGLSRRVYVAQDCFTNAATDPSITLKLTDRGSVGGDWASKIAYGAKGNPDTGVKDNRDILLVGTNNDTKNLWLSESSTDPLHNLPNYGGNAPTSLVFGPSEKAFYVADNSNLYGTINQGANIPSLTANLPSTFSNPSTLEFISTNGVNALLVGGVNNAANLPSGPLVVADSNSYGTLSGWRYFGQNLPNSLISAMSYNPAVDVLAVGTFGSGAYLLYDVTSNFKSAERLQFGLANNDSTPDASLLTDGTRVSGGASFSRALFKTGTGTLTISGAASYTGGTTIDEGTVRAGNSYALGTGAVNNNATLDIGMTTLTIGGAYTQGAGAASTLMVDVNGSSSGSIVAKGITTVHADNNLVLNVSNYIPNHTDYTIIQGAAGGAIAAPVISLTGNKKADFIPTTIGDNLILTSDRSANGFASDSRPGDANAWTIGNVLDNIHNFSTDMSNVLNTMEGLNKTQVASALDTLVPEVDAGVINTGRAALNNFTGVSIDRVEKAHIDAQTTRSARYTAQSGISTGEAGNPDGLWAKGYGSYLSQGIRNGIAGYHAWNAGTAMGVDHRFSDAITLGVSGGYAYGNVNSDVNNANTNINSAQTTLYGGYQNQKRPFFIDTAFSFAYNWYAGRRDINVGNVILRTANASYGGEQYGAYLGGGYQFNLTEAIRFTPLVSLQYNNLHINSYNETGAGALNLNAGTQNYNQLQTGLGARVATTLNLQWGKLTPEAHAKWFYDFIGDPFAVTSTFNGGGAVFGSNGAKPALNSFNVGGELNLALKDEVAIIGKVDTQLREGFSGVYGSFTVRF